LQQAVPGTFCLFFSSADQNSIFLQARWLFCITTLCGPLSKEVASTGVKAVGLWISDGGQAMLNAIGSKFASSKRQRCVMHKMENVLSYVPAKQRDQIEPELKALFYQKGRPEADQAVAAFVEKYQRIYPTAIECLQRDPDACLTFYAFPKEHWKTIRTIMYNPARFSQEKQRNRARSIHNAS